MAADSPFRPGDVPGTPMVIIIATAALTLLFNGIVY